MPTEYSEMGQHWKCRICPKVATENMQGTFAVIARVVSNSCNLAISALFTSPGATNTPVNIIIVIDICYARTTYLTRRLTHVANLTAGTVRFFPLRNTPHELALGRRKHCPQQVI